MDRVVKFYLNGDDFNGLPIMAKDPTPDEIWPVIEELVTEGEIQVVTNRDFPNPHIRPWSSRRTIADQIESVELIRSGNNAIEEDRVCLYPTPRAMLGRLDHSLYVDEPYRRELAKGNGDLELRYFTFDAMEGYRNDPRYHFTYWDFGLSFGIGDDAYVDEGEPNKDKVASVDVGFAYITPQDDDAPIKRRICLFLKDLSCLSPEHQRRIETYEIKGDELGTLSPHPMWYAAQMGNWPDGIGPFEKILLEMEAINELSTNAYGEPLFRSTERPREFGWVLRASQAEWDQFVVQADKLLSDNLSSKALDAMGAPKKDANNTDIGTLNRLQWVLENRTTLNLDQVRARLQSLRDVREARQKPAHALRQNVTDRTIIRKQRDLLAEISLSVEALRILLSRHSSNSSWTADELLEGTFYAL
jgi:hypothetical protein